jgi:hypothetical protein
MIINTSLSLVKKSRVFLTYIGLFVSSIVVIASMLLANSLYLEEDMSLIFLCITGIGLASLLDFNLSKALLFSLTQWQCNHKYLYSVIYISAVIGVGLLIIIEALLFLLVNTEILNVSMYDKSHEINYLTIAIFLLPFLIFSQSIQAMFESNDLFLHSTLYKSAQAVAPYLVAVIGFFSFDNITAIVFLMVLSRVVIISVAVVFVSRYFVFQKSNRENDYRVRRIFIRRFLHGFIGGFLTLLLLHGDRLIVFLVLESYMYNLYMILSELVLKYVSLIAAASSVFTTRMTYIVRNGLSTINSLFTVSHLTFFVLASPLIFIYLVHDMFNIDYFNGNEYFLSLYIFGMFYSVMSLSANILIIATGRFSMLSVVNFVEVLLIGMVFYYLRNNLVVAVFVSVLIKGVVNFLIQSIYISTVKNVKNSILIILPASIIPLFMIINDSVFSLMLLVLLNIFCISYIFKFFKNDRVLLKKLI